MYFPYQITLLIIKVVMIPIIGPLHFMKETGGFFPFLLMEHIRIAIAIPFPEVPEWISRIYLAPIQSIDIAQSGAQGQVGKFQEKNLWIISFLLIF